MFGIEEVGPGPPEGVEPVVVVGLTKEEGSSSGGFSSSCSE